MILSTIFNILITLFILFIIVGVIYNSRDLLRNGMYQMQYVFGELKTRSFQVLLVAFFLLTTILFSYFFTTLGNWKNKAFNTTILIFIGFLSLALFTQYTQQML